MEKAKGREPKRGGGREREGRREEGKFPRGGKGFLSGNAAPENKKKNAAPPPPPKRPATPPPGLNKS